MVGAAGQVILNTKGVRRPHGSRRTHDHLRGFQEKASISASDTPLKGYMITWGDLASSQFDAR
jgi:hypothetical protein